MARDDFSSLGLITSLLNPFLLCFIALGCLARGLDLLRHAYTLHAPAFSTLHILSTSIRPV